MKRFVVLTLMLLLATLTACASKNISLPEEPHERVFWSSSPERPGWIHTEPGEMVDGILTFIGLSGRCPSEKASREDALRNATSAVVKYMRSLAKNKFDKTSHSFDLQGDVVDPIGEFEKRMSVEVIDLVKAKGWYVEKRQTLTGVAYVSYVLSQVPQGAVDELYSSITRSLAKDAERKATEVDDAVAKAQAEKAAEFWTRMAEQGMTE